MDENKENMLNGETDKKPEEQAQNTNKITVFEVIIALLLIGGIIFYFSPNFLLKADMRKASKTQTNAAIFVSKALSEFSTNKKIKASVVSAKLVEELNAVNKNAFTKKNPAYSLDEICSGCVIIEADDKINSITVSAYDKEGALLTRTLIQPPSFVTYTKDLKSKKADKKDKK